MERGGGDVFFAKRHYLLDSPRQVCYNRLRRFSQPDLPPGIAYIPCLSIGCGSVTVLGALLCFKGATDTHAGLFAISHRLAALLAVDRPPLHPRLGQLLNVLLSLSFTGHSGHASINYPLVASGAANLAWCLYSWRLWRV